MSYPGVYRDEGPNGGDRLNVGSAGSIRVFAVAGADIVGSGGSRASHIADRTVATATGGASATALNSSVKLLASGVNEILAALRSIGILATS